MGVIDADHRPGRGAVVAADVFVQNRVRFARADRQLQLSR